MNSQNDVNYVNHELIDSVKDEKDTLIKHLILLILCISSILYVQNNLLILC